MKQGCWQGIGTDLIRRSADGTPNGAGGWFPVTNLTLDTSGGVYGTTLHGGSFVGAACINDGCGVVFELSTVSSAP